MENSRSRSPKTSGVPTIVNRYDGMIHEFIRLPFGDADWALDDIAAARI